MFLQNESQNLSVSYQVQFSITTHDQGQQITQDPAYGSYFLKISRTQPLVTIIFHFPDHSNSPYGPIDSPMQLSRSAPQVDFMLRLSSLVATG